MAQETQTGAVYQPRSVGWGGKWEGVSKGKGYMYTYGWSKATVLQWKINSLKKKVQTSSYEISPGGVITHSIVIIVSNAALHVWKLLKINLKRVYQKK